MASEALQVRKAGLPEGHPLIAEPEEVLAALQGREDVAQPCCQLSQ